jgi:adenosylcobinamide-GDP ribazoletransferase
VRRAVGFLTSLGGPAEPSAHALAWFAPVGVGLGLVLGGVWWLAGRWWPAGLAAVLVVLADLGLTGLLHFDGLIDSADGLLPPLPRDRRLAVMAAPDVGAFGMATATAVLLARWAALAALRPAPLLLAGLWGLSRTAMAVVVRTQPYARADQGGGLASAFLEESRPGVGPALAGGAAGSVLLAVLWRGAAGSAAALAAGVTAAAVVALARRRIGGFTGDVLGAAGVLAETVGLVVAAARW